MTLLGVGRVFVVAALLASPGEFAAWGASGSSAATTEAAFQAMLAHPEDSSLILAYVDAAEQAGDLEGAIGALTALLLKAPDDHALTLHLARLYHALGAEEMAQTLLSAPAQHSLIGRLASGLLSQSNATAGPASTLRAYGIDIAPQGKQAPLADIAGFVAADARHRVTIGDGESWDTGMNAYVTRQFRLEHENVSYLRLTSGPTWTLNSATGSAVQAYALSELFALGGNLLFASGGAGLTVRMPLPGDLALWLESEAQSRSFHNSDNTPLATAEEGVVVTERATIDQSFPGGDHIVLRVQGSDDRAHGRYYAYTEWRISPAVEHHFNLWDRTWIAAAELSWARRPYGGPDPLVDSTLTRDDTEMRLAASLLIPIDERWSAQVNVTKYWEGSTLPNYRYQNTVATVAAQISF